jgi:1,4-alpha-glucan branching enzyme
MNEQYVKGNIMKKANGHQNGEAGAAGTKPRRIEIEFGREDGLDYPAKVVTKQVNFYFAAPEALSVEITGDFNDWQPAHMSRLLDGWWFIRLQLSHGYHQYRFVVDGEARLDPQASGAAYDEKNEQVSLVAVN